MSQSRGTFVISIDLELAWGTCDRPIQPRARHAIELEREIIRRLLDLFSNFNVRATWAVVGHLLLTECTWEGDIVHPEISRPIARNLQRDWFFQHPKDQNDPLWYGRDIIDWILDASPKQEIGSHSFAHILYDESITHLDAIRSDVETAAQLHEDLGLPFEVFVFPRNAVGALDLLSKAGVTVYRGNTRRWYKFFKPRPVGRLLNLLQFLFGVTPPTVAATTDENGMVNLPDSMLLFSQAGIRGLIPSRSLIRMGIAGLNRAVDRKEIFHLWFHASNFAYNSDKQFHVFETILRHAERLREDGLIEFLPMGDIRKKTVKVD